MPTSAPASPVHPVRLVSQWFIKPGCEEEAAAALTQLAAAVLETEPDTLAYLVHTAVQGDPQRASVPPAAPGSVLFYECYRDADAFARHLNGPAFTRFVREHGALFVAMDGKTFLTAQFLTLLAGEVRPAARPARTPRRRA